MADIPQSLYESMKGTHAACVFMAHLGCGHAVRLGSSRFRYIKVSQTKAFQDIHDVNVD